MPATGTAPRWRPGAAPSIVHGNPQDPREGRGMADTEPISELLSRWEQLRREGQSITPEELCREHPELLPRVRQQLEALQAFASAPGRTPTHEGDGDKTEAKDSLPSVA